MKKSSIIYEEERMLTAKYRHPRSHEYLNYKSTIRIKESGKTPVEMILKLDGIYPLAAPMPAEEHRIKAPAVLDLFSKVSRWFKKYGYELE